MVVYQKDSCGIAGKCLFEDFTRIHRRAINRTAKHFLVAQHFMSVIQKKHCEDFVLSVAKENLHVWLSKSGACDREAGTEFVQYAALSTVNQGILINRSIYTLNHELGKFDFVSIGLRWL